MTLDATDPYAPRLGAICTLCDVALDAPDTTFGRALIAAFEEQHGHDGILDALEAADELADAVDEVIRRVRDEILPDGADSLLGSLPALAEAFHQIRDEDGSDT